MPSEPTTPTGKRLIDKQVWVGVSRDLKAEVLAIEAEAREQERALADELAEALRNVTYGPSDGGPSNWPAAREALAKWEASKT